MGLFQKSTLRWATTAISVSLASATAFATDGYFAHGYGLKAKGMGGAAIAVSQDAFGGATNPASLLWAGDKLEIGVDLFSPSRSATFSPAPGFNIKSESTNESFLIPEIGYSRVISEDLAIGITVYGNGGMNTEYKPVPNLLGPGVNNILGGSTHLGVDMSQLIAAPTLAWAIDEDHVLGLSVLLAAQQFKVYGIQAFAPISAAPGRLTDKGYDESYGIGFRVGYSNRISDQLTLGASYSPQIQMSEFDKYAGLFAGQGGFDLPENYGIGLAYTPSADWLFALDYQFIDYSKVSSVGNPSNIPAPLGSNNAPGFGWNAISVYKFGVQHQLNDRWTLRAGYNQSENPVNARDVTFNILAPGVIEDHYTLGATLRTASGGEWTFTYMYAPENSVTGARPAAFGGGQDYVEMHQNSFGVQYSF